MIRAQLVHHAFRFHLGIAALGLAFVLTVPPLSAQPDDDSWVGKTIIIKKDGIRLRKTDEKDREDYVAALTYHNYKVLADKGGLLQVRQNDVEGWFDKKDAVRLEDAVDYFSDRIRTHPKDSFAYVRRGVARSINGELDVAIKDLDEAIRLDPNDAAAFSCRGGAWTDKGQYDKAIKDLDEAIQLEPMFAVAFNTRGYAWVGKKEYEKAIKDLDEAIRLDPKYALAFCNRGAAWAEKKQYNKAIKDLEEALRLDPKDAVSFKNRGYIWYIKQEFDKAIKDYDEALRIDPKDTRTICNRGYAWSAKEDYDNAIKDYDEAIRIDAKWVFAFMGRGLAWCAKKDYEKAIKDYNEVIRLDPNYGDALNYSAWLLATCPEAKYRDGKRAVELATKACEASDWKDANCVNTLAAACAEAGQFDEAVKWQEKALLDAFYAITQGNAAKERLQLYHEKRPYHEK